MAHGGWSIRGDLKMPAVDRLAAQGARFTQFYVASGVCSPSRTGFMTGRFPARCGIHDYLADSALNRKRGVADFLDPAVPTVTRVLQQAGYATGHFGKWHLSGAGGPKPEQYGIDRYRTCIAPPRGRPRSSEAIADEVLAFVDEHRGGPFYVNAWLYDPHSPLHPTDEMMEPYRALGSGWPKHPSAFEIYYGVLSYLDRQVGRILDRLEERGLADNTVVVFSSDNGPETDLIPFTSFYGAAATAGPFRGVKRSLLRGRHPHAVHRALAGPDAGGRGWTTGPCWRAWISSPPCAAWPEYSRPAPWMARTFRRRFRAGPRPASNRCSGENRYPVYGHVLDMSPMLAIREGRWKLLLNPDRSRVELYDVPADPSEMTNRAGQFPDVVKRLSARALAWQATLPKGPVDPGRGQQRLPLAAAVRPLPRPALFPAPGTSETMRAAPAGTSRRWRRRRRPAADRSGPATSPGSEWSPAGRSRTRWGSGMCQR